MPTRWAAWLTEPCFFLFWEFYLLPGSGGEHAFSPSTMSSRSVWSTEQVSGQLQRETLYPSAQPPLHCHSSGTRCVQQTRVPAEPSDKAAHTTDRKSLSSLQWQLSHSLAMSGQGMFQTHFTRQWTKSNGRQGFTAPNSLDWASVPTALIHDEWVTTNIPNSTECPPKNMVSYSPSFP